LAGTVQLPAEDNPASVPEPDVLGGELELYFPGEAFRNWSCITLCIGAMVRLISIDRRCPRTAPLGREETGKKKKK